MSNIWLNLSRLIRVTIAQKLMLLALRVMPATMCSHFAPAMYEAGIAWGADLEAEIMASKERRAA